MKKKITIKFKNLNWFQNILKCFDNSSLLIIIFFLSYFTYQGWLFIKRNFIDNKNNNISNMYLQTNKFFLLIYLIFKLMRKLLKLMK